MELLAAFNSMHGKVIALAGHGEIGPLIHIRWFANSAPRAVSQI